MREAILGAWECDFKQFSEKTDHDLSNAARGFNVKSIEDLHRNLNVAARQNFNGKISRQARWHVAQRCGVIESLDHHVCEPTAEDERDSVNAPLNNNSFIPNPAKFSMGPETYRDLLNTKDCLYVYHQVNLCFKRIHGFEKMKRMHFECNTHLPFCHTHFEKPDRFCLKLVLL